MSERVELPPRPSTSRVLSNRRRPVALYGITWTLLGSLVTTILGFVAGEASVWPHLGAVFLGWCLVGILAPLVWWLTYEKRRRGEDAASRLEGQLAQAHLQLLKMQVRPHFLFNTLNSISALMHRDVDAADRMMVQLSGLLRLSLERDERHKVRLSDELDFLKRYLDLERIRFRDRLEIEIDVDAECLPARVPRLILQPLVENAIRHGIALRSAAGQVEISAERRGERLRVCVGDDGPGIPGGRLSRMGVGLGNTLDRLEQLYGEHQIFQIKNAAAGGLEVHLEIPFEVDVALKT